MSYGNISALIQCGLPNFSTTFFETEERIEISNKFNTFDDSLELSLYFGDDVAIGSSFSDANSSIVVFRWCFGSDLVLFLAVSHTDSVVVRRWVRDVNRYDSRAVI
jgi:hypothetical protein